MPEIILVDTTLRDGEQAPGFAFAPQLKIRLARLLDAAGVGQIEAGVPAMGTTERDVVRGVRAACAQARVSAWNRLAGGGHPPLPGLRPAHHPPVLPHFGPTNQRKAQVHPAAGAGPAAPAAWHWPPVGARK